MQAPSLNMRLLHKFLANQIRNNINENEKKKFSFLSLVKRHNELTKKNKTHPIVSPTKLNTFVLNRGLSSQININLKSQTLAELDLSRFKILNEIGSGSYSTIYLTEEIDTQMQYALKKLIIDEVEVVAQIKNEIELVRFLSKKDINIIPFINFCINKLDATTHVIYLLMPLAEGDFSQEVIKHKSHRNFTYIDVARELIATLATMQRENICHRDIKPQNILYLDEHSMIEAQKFCLCDFDEVIQIKSTIDEKIKLKVKGTEMFMSPILYKAFKNGELFAEHNPYKSDVYSLGLCFVYAITKSYNYLYRIRDNSDKENKIFLSKYLDNQEINEELIDLVEMMIKSDERDRLDFIQLEKYLQSNTYEL